MPRRRRPPISFAAALLAACTAQGQSFEAASIKPANPNLPDGRIVVGMQAPTGGPGTNDPGRIRYAIVCLRLLVAEAYDLKPTGKMIAPDWLDTDFFQVEATMPPATTRAQFRVMLQKLLAERFALKLHEVTAEQAVYALTVAKSGPKMKASAQTEDIPLPPDAFHRREGPPNLGPDGFPAHPNVPATGAGMFTTIGTLGIRLTARQRTMHDLVDALNAFAKRTVVDDTGLTGKYDFVLTFYHPGATTPDGEALPEIFSAIQSQLGLKLETRKAGVDTLVIDHIAKTPTEN